MGVSGGSSFLFRIENASISDVVGALRILKQTVTPVVYVDCNWVAHYLGKSNGCYVSKTVDTLYILAHAGFKVVPVVDGAKRHHSKVASITRNLERELNQIDVLKLCTKALSLNGKLKNATSEEE